MGGVRRARAPILLAITLATLCAAARAEDAPPGHLSLEVSPREGTVGDSLHATLTLDVPTGTRLEPPRLSEAFGEFSVLSGSWTGPEQAPGVARYRWTGAIAAYKTGTLEVPAISVEIPGAAGPTRVRSEPVAVTIKSVLPSGESQKEAKAPDLGDLKPVASIAPNYGPIEKALAALLALLVVSGVAWGLQRRYAARLAAVPAPEDPFRRTPPHVWAYEELQHLLDRRLAEEGRVDLFFAELSRILKTYLGGRYRLELLEHTTGELVPLLRQAGAPSTPVLESRALLERADLVKFAREMPLPEVCRKAVEEAYRIVDSTKPVEEPAAGAA